MSGSFNIPSNTSIPLAAAAPQPANPLAGLGDTVRTGAALLGLQAQQQQLAARQAIGQAYSQATDPNTGITDYNRLYAIASQDPRASYMLGDLASQQLGREKTQTEIAGQKQDQAIKGASYINNVAGALLNQPGGIKAEDIVNAATQAVSDGIISRDQAANHLMSVPVQTGNAAQDAASNRAHVAQLYFSTLPPAQQMQMLQPSITPINTGGGTALLNTNQFSPGGVGVMGSLPMSMTPAEASAPTQTGVTPQGAPVMGTRQQFVQQAQGGSPLGTGRPPAALVGPGGAPATPDATPATPPGVVTSLPPAQAAAQQQQGEASAKAFADIADQGAQARSQGAVLGNMLADAANFTSGQPGANSFKATLTKYAPTLAGALGVTPDSVAANESFDKLANQIAGAQGAGSDARLAVAQAGNPSSHLSPAGADLILRQLQGNSDYLQARSKLAASYPNQADRAGFESNVGANLDPRAFQYARLTPEQKATYFKSLSPADRTALKASYGYATSNGLIGAPGGQ